MTEKQMKKQEEIIKELLPLKDKLNTIYDMSYLLNVSYIKIPMHCRMFFIADFSESNFEIPYTTFGYVSKDSRVVVYSPRNLITVKNSKTNEVLYPTKAEAKKFISLFNDFYKYVHEYVDSLNKQFKN